MLRKLRERIYTEEKGFTLIELLVVILIIGILAAIALPAFLSQRAKAQDSDSKSQARNAVTAVESCYADTQNYSQCYTAADLPAGVTVTQGGGANASTSFRASHTSASGNVFWIEKQNGGAPTRGCSTAGNAGCKTGGTW